MIDFGFDKLALIGAVALIVIGPERLPKVARTVGHLLGKAQRYMADVKAEVNRSIELDEIKKMKTQFEDVAREAESSANALNEGFHSFDGDQEHESGSSSEALINPVVPQYVNPRKKWRLKKGSIPHWYKQRHGVRARVQSGAARMARFKPRVF